MTLDSSVKALRRQAETLFGVKGRLVSPAGECLRGAMTVGEAGLQSGDLLMMQVSQTCVASCRHAFVAILGDASAVSWGQRDVVHKRLFDVQQIQTNSFACAAIMTDGSVVTWVLKAVVVTVVSSEINCLTSNIFNPPSMPSLLSGTMVWW